MAKARRGQQHYLKDAFYAGMRSMDFEQIMAAQVHHNSLKGEWETGVISPSLVGTVCRLARLKRFMGHGPQPGVTDMGYRQGIVDPVSRLNFVRGFDMEGIVVPALKATLGVAVVDHAPTLLFRWRYEGDDPLLSMWTTREFARGTYSYGKPVEQLANGIVFAGHPDVLIEDASHDYELALVQIKCPSLFKLERILRLGEQDALETYRAQMITEMYIGRMMGYPITRSYLFVAAFEGTINHSLDELCRVIELPWEEPMRMVPEEIAREIIQDHDKAVTLGEWPPAYPARAWDVFPCEYCQYSRLGNFELIACDEGQEWDRYAKTGETRLTVPPPDDTNPQIVRHRPRRRTG